MDDSATGKTGNAADLAAPAKAQVNILSTDAARAGERFSYWREAICQAMFNITIDAPPDHFSARITARAAGPIRFASSECSGYRVVRSRSDIDTGPADHYSVFVPLSGQSIIGQCDQTYVYKPTDICISDGRFPFHAALTAGTRAYVVIPRAMIDRRAPWLARRPLHRLAADLPFVDLARRHMQELTGANAAISDSASTLLTENLCNLLALATATDVPPRGLQPELQIEAMLAFCRQNLHDPDLSPQRVADHVGISVRTLHLRFQEIGQSFGRWVLQSRLEACRLALLDANQRALNISEIAYRWGFNDLSHFNKAFRAQFGRTPSEWRHAAGD